LSKGWLKWHKRLPDSQWEKERAKLKGKEGGKNYEAI
jgi:hypothetical protein